MQQQVSIEVPKPNRVVVGVVVGQEGSGKSKLLNDLVSHLKKDPAFRPFDEGQGARTKFLKRVAVPIPDKDAEIVFLDTRGVDVTSNNPEYKSLLKAIAEGLEDGTNLDVKKEWTTRKDPRNRIDKFMIVAPSYPFMKKPPVSTSGTWWPFSSSSTPNTQNPSVLTPAHNILKTLTAEVTPYDRRKAPFFAITFMDKVGTTEDKQALTQLVGSTADLFDNFIFRFGKKCKQEHQPICLTPDCQHRCKNKDGKPGLDADTCKYFFKYCNDEKCTHGLNEEGVADREKLLSLLTGIATENE